MRGDWKALGLACALAASPAFALSEAELLEKAKQERILQLHTNPLDYPEVLARRFQKAYPWVELRHEVLEPSDSQGLSAGLRASEPGASADVVLRCQEPNILDWIGASWLALLDDLPNWDKRQRGLQDDARVIHLVGAPHVILFNSKRVADADAPRSFADLAKPKWRGKVVLRDPRKGNSGAFLEEFMHATRGGLDWYSELGRNRALVVENTRQLIDELLKGERLVAVSRDVEWLSVPRNEQTQHVKMLFPSDELPYQYQMAVVNQRAPHPHVARLFANWVLSDDGVAALEAAGYSVGRRQQAHLARRGVWRMDHRARHGGYDARRDEAARRLREGGASFMAPEPEVRAQAAR